MSNALSTISQDSDRLTANWTSCLACGTVLRSLQKLNMDVPEFCNSCFEDHCWQGNSASSPPSFLAPSALLTNPDITFEIWNQTIFFNGSVDGNSSSVTGQHRSTGHSQHCSSTTSIFVGILSVIYWLIA